MAFSPAAAAAYARAAVQRAVEAAVCGIADAEAISLERVHGHAGHRAALRDAALAAMVADASLDGIQTSLEADITALNGAGAAGHAKSLCAYAAWVAVLAVEDKHGHSKAGAGNHWNRQNELQRTIIDTIDTNGGMVPLVAALDAALDDGGGGNPADPAAAKAALASMAELAGRLYLQETCYYNSHAGGHVDALVAGYAASVVAEPTFVSDLNNFQANLTP